MSEGNARLGLFIETTIFFAVSLFIGFVIAIIYTKLTNKTFKDLHKHYWNFFIVLAIVLYIVIGNLL